MLPIKRLPVFLAPQSLPGPPPSPPRRGPSRRGPCSPRTLIGKPARDVFTEGGGFGLIELALKTKSENRLEFTIWGPANTETTEVTRGLETA